MAVAQRGTRVLLAQVGIGLLDDLAQQLALREGLQGAVERAGTVADVPAGILNHPVVVDLVGREQVVERHRVANLRTLDVRRQFEQMVVQVFGIHLVVDVGRVVEEHLHYAVVVLVALLEGVVGFACLVVPLLVLQLLVPVVHVPHIVLRCVVADAQFRVQAL